jgi:hypothetical protein
MHLDLQAQNASLFQRRVLMSVPSLSWQKDRLYLGSLKLRKQGVFAYLVAVACGVASEALQLVSRDPVAAYDKNCHSFLSFPMFVPSLSW